MSVAAVVMMIVAVLVIWGGFVTATRFLLTHPMPFGDDVEPPRPLAPKDV